MANKETFIFFTSASAATNGSEFSTKNTDPLSNVVVAISGSFTGKAVNFEGKGGIGGYVALSCTNLSTGTSGSQAVGSGDEIWSIPACGIDYIRCRVASLSSGSITAIGTYVIS